MDAGHGVAIKLAFSSVRQDKNYRDDPHVQLQKEKKNKRRNTNKSLDALYTIGSCIHLCDWLNLLLVLIQTLQLKVIKIV